MSPGLGKINEIERYFLKRLCKKIVRQGTHRKRIIEYYRIIMDAARKEFTEDNKSTLEDFMLKCFEVARKYR